MSWSTWVIFCWKFEDETVELKAWYNANCGPPTNNCCCKVLVPPIPSELVTNEDDIADGLKFNLNGELLPSSIAAVIVLDMACTVIPTNEGALFVPTVNPIELIFSGKIYILSPGK